MKTKILAGWLLAGIFSFTLVAETVAQCSDKVIRKIIKDGLEQYVFETASSKPFNSFGEPRKSIDAGFTVYAKENYRVLNLCQGFNQPVEFIILDADKKEIFRSQDMAQNKYDFTAEKGGEYTIRFKFQEQNNPDACVAFAIGYK